MIMKIKDHLKKEWKFYLKHKDELVKKYLGKHVIIYKNSVRGAFDDDEEAFNYALDSGFKPNHFMIHKVVKKEPVYLMSPVIQEVGSYE